jgi:hypothetical protein
MKRIVIPIAVAALAVPALALAKSPSNPATASCKAQLRVMGATNFHNVYGTFGTCVSRMRKASPAQRQALLNAAKICRAEQQANAGAFTARYGTNANKKNAFGKCVSQHAQTQNNTTSGGNQNVAAKTATANFTFTAGAVANRHVVFDVHLAKGKNPAGGSFTYSDATSSYSVRVDCVAISNDTAYIGGLVQNAAGFTPALPSPTYLLAKAVDNGSSGDVYSGSFVNTNPCGSLGTVNPADGPFAITSGFITVKS